ncbi:MAG: nucleotide exchange factor GrpE [Fimbriimonadaceae bacterium]
MRKRHPPAEDDAQARSGAGQKAEPTREEAQDELIRLLTLERDQAQDQLLRTMADLQNFRKRAEQERNQLRQFATEQLVHDLLPVLDNFERTLAAIQSGASTEAIGEGVGVIERQLRSVLESRQVQRLKTVGQPFDPEIHEALGSIETEDFPEGTVAEDVEPGYKMGDKVIRPARVRVAKRAER